MYDWLYVSQFYIRTALAPEELLKHAIIQPFVDVITTRYSDTWAVIL